MNSEKSGSCLGGKNFSSHPARHISRRSRPRVLVFFAILFLELAACSPLPAAQVLEPTSTPEQAAQLPTPALVSSPAPINPSATASPLPSLAATQTATRTPSPTETLTPTPDITIHFAVIGDFGEGNQAEADVASLVKSWQPDFILTTGDNNYPQGEAKTIDDRIGKYYSNFIYPYAGKYTPGASLNRFFPTLGNHDWMSKAAMPYFDYFTLPGNERYYDFSWGAVHFYALDSNTEEPDKVGASSPQAAWLKQKLSEAKEPWKVVYSHIPPYSSGLHGGADYMRWPFQAWGASIYLGGHDHDYERLNLNGFPYIVDGLGGGPIYQFKTAVEGSQVRFNKNYGALLVTANVTEMKFQFITRTGELIDEYTLTK